MWKFIVQIANHLSCLFNLLLYRSFYTKPYYEFELPAGDVETLSAVPAAAASSEEECAVCLCKINQGGEIRELRCAHPFHKACLDRWTGLNHTTCPICRSFLAPPDSAAESQSQIQVLRFRFSSFCADTDRDAWWLR